MTLRLNRRPGARLRGIAAASTLALAAGAAAVVGTAAPAQAVDTTFTCQTVLGPQMIPATVDTDAPTEVLVGSTLDPLVSVVMTLPVELSNTLRSLGVTALTGTIDSATTVNGAPAPLTLAIPLTAIDPLGTGSIILTAAGSGDPITATAPGQIVFATGEQVAALLLTGGPLPTTELTCLPTPNPLIVDTVTVKAPAPPPPPAKVASTTDLKVKYKARTDKVKAVAVVRSATGIPVTGVVKFVLKKGKKTIRRMKDRLSSGRAKVVFKKIRKPGRYKVIAKYGGSATVLASRDVARFRIRR